jgi:hypothetical protein
MECKECNGTISDYQEIVHNLCWTCMSNNETFIEQNANVANIKQEELSNNHGVSIVIKDSNGTTFKLAGKNKDKKPPLNKTLDENGDKPIIESPVVDPTIVEPPVNKTGTKKETTAPSDGKTKKIVPNPDELKVIRESKEIMTKSARAKVKAFALINQAILESGQFEISATLKDTHETVSSAPYNDKNIEDIIMTTTMELLNTIDQNKKKK